MSGRWNRRQLGVAAAAAVDLLCLGAAAGAGDGTPASADRMRWFQATEQALMDSLAPGDKGPRERLPHHRYVSPRRSRLAHGGVAHVRRDPGSSGAGGLSRGLAG